MSTSDDKDIVRRLWFQELWDKWNVNTADELFTPGYQLHLPGMPAAIDREGTKQVVQMFGASFPDLQHTVHEIIAEGSTVAARWTVNGTHRGDFQGIPATGRSVSLSGATVHHLAGGKITETWLTFDSQELLQQLFEVPQASRA
jgi:steroid delta-isomerase-like uncharacterized protein